MDDDCVLCLKSKDEGRSPSPPHAFFCFNILCSCSLPPPVMWQEYQCGDRLEPSTLWTGNKNSWQTELGTADPARPNSMFYARRYWATHGHALWVALSTLRQGNMKVMVWQWCVTWREIITFDLPLMQLKAEHDFDFLNHAQFFYLTLGSFWPAER